MSKDAHLATSVATISAFTVVGEGTAVVLTCSATIAASDPSSYVMGATSLCELTYLSYDRATGFVTTRTAINPSSFDIGNSGASPMPTRSGTTLSFTVTINLLESRRFCPGKLDGTITLTGTICTITLANSDTVTVDAGSATFPFTLATNYSGTVSDTTEYAYGWTSMFEVGKGTGSSTPTSYNYLTGFSVGSTTFNGMADRPTFITGSTTEIGYILFNGTSQGLSMAFTTVPTVTTQYTAFALLICPTPSSMTAGQIMHINGRWPSGNKSWCYDFIESSGALLIRHRTVDSAQAVTTHTATVPSELYGTVILVDIQRNGTAGDIFINGVSAGTTSSFPATGHAGSGANRFGASAESGSNENWYSGKVYGFAFYATNLAADLRAFVRHQLRTHEGSFQLGAGYTPTSQAATWTKRPIFVINLVGQTPSFTNQWGYNSSYAVLTDQAGVESYLTTELDQLITEVPGIRSFGDVMFNRPGGKRPDHNLYSDISNGTTGFDAFRQAAFNVIATTYAFGNGNKASPWRCWFYTGFGRQVDTVTGAVTGSGLMDNRVVAPGTSAVYDTYLLDQWESINPNFVWLFNDAAVRHPIIFARLAADATGHYLVGEAIPEVAAQISSAAWFALAEQNNAPWWLNSDRSQGIDPNFDVRGSGKYVYIGIQYNATDTTMQVGQAWNEGSYPNQADLTFLIRRGAIPVCWDNSNTTNRQAMRTRVRNAWFAAQGQSSRSVSSARAGRGRSARGR